jgi:hypothetical protein
MQSEMEKPRKMGKITTTDNYTKTHREYTNFFINIVRMLETSCKNNKKEVASKD